MNVWMYSTDDFHRAKSISAENYCGRAECVTPLHSLAISPSVTLSIHPSDWQRPGTPVSLSPCLVLSLFLSLHCQFDYVFTSWMQEQWRQRRASLRFVIPAQTKSLPSALHGWPFLDYSGKEYEKKRPACQHIHCGCYFINNFTVPI